jgi:murein DD-endopeptidase / murein LD-carboxypeptidase
MKKKLILIAFMVLSITGATAQNQFSDYVQYLKNNTPNLKPLGSFVMEWYGVKYKLGGNTKRGIDCSQFTKKLYSEVYGKKLGNNCAEQWKQTNRIKKDSLLVGDIVFFRSTQSPSGWHCGLYLGKDTFAHAANKKEGVKISSLSEPRYLRSYKGAGRLN